MEQFNYIAKDSSGKTTKGIVEANDRKGAIDILRKQQLVILSLKEGKGVMKRGLFSFAGLKKVNIEDIVVFSRMLATIVESGIPVANALDILGEQQEKPDLKNRIIRVRDDVRAGASLSEAMSKDRVLFSSFYVNMVRAGESSGSLNEILDRLADYLEKSHNLQRKVKSALSYPAIVAGMALGITMILLIKVIPIFAEVYDGFDAQLPLPTQILVDVSNWLRTYFYIVLIAIVAIFFLVSRYAKTVKGRKFFDNMKLNLPIFGIIIKKVAISKFARTFSTLSKSGVPILSALEIVGKTAGNVVIEEAVEHVKVNVREGENIATPLAKLGIFPPMVVRMINVGEKTGELEKMLTKISEFYEAQVDAAVSSLTSLIEPLIIAFLGIVVGGVVICMFLPILQMSSVVKF